MKETKGEQERNEVQKLKANGDDDDEVEANDPQL